jgi:DNA-binding NtrC family response regulator
MDYTNKTILIIEDEEALNSAFKKSFERKGFKVLSADNGADGFELIKNVRPDVVILDLIMPEMNGEEVLEAMNKEGLTDSIPVIVVSNKSDGASLYRCKKLGAREYLIKVNVNLDDILEVIERILND